MIADIIISSLALRFFFFFFCYEHGGKHEKNGRGWRCARCARVSVFLSAVRTRRVLCVLGAKNIKKTTILYFGGVLTFVVCVL